MGVPLIGADSVLDKAAPVAISVSPSGATGFPKDNLTDDRPFNFYKMSSSVATLTIKSDAGVGNTNTVGYFMALAHDFFDPAEDTLGACTLTFEHSADDAAYTLIFAVTVADNKIVARSFTNISRRFFRLTVTRAAAFVASVGQIAWGVPMRFPFGISTGFDPNAERVDSRFNRSQTGNIIGGFSNYVERRANLQLKFIPDTFVDDATLGGFKEFWDNHGSIEKPFLFMWNATLVATNVVKEKDSFFGLIDPGRGVDRSLATQLAEGDRDLGFQVVGIKE